MKTNTKISHNEERTYALYLSGRKKMILRDQELCQALGYDKTGQMKIIRKKGGKDNRLRPIFSFVKKILASRITKIQKLKIFSQKWEDTHKMTGYLNWNFFGIRNYTFCPCIPCSQVRYMGFFYTLFLLLILFTLFSLSQNIYANNNHISGGENYATYIFSSLLLFGAIFYLGYYALHYKQKKALGESIKKHFGDIYIHPISKIREKIKNTTFHTIFVPIGFFTRIIIRSCIHPEGFMNPFLRAYILNPFHTGLLLNGLYDRLTPKNSFTHSLVVAKNGGGKTSSYIIPNLLTLDNCSILTVDLSGELFEKTSGAMKQKGYEVKMINPTKLEISEQYNPLAFVKNNKDILELAHILIYANNSKQGDQFWNMGAMKLLEILIFCLISQKEKLQDLGYKNHSKFCTLSQLRYLLNNFGQNGDGLKNFISAYADYQTYHDWKGFISGYEKTTLGFVATALASLNIVGNEDIATLTAKNSIDFHNLRKIKTIYYLQVPSHLLHVYAPIISIFYNQFFNHAMEKLPNKNDLDIYALIDEAGHIKMGNNFGTVITNIRKYHVSISLILQSLSQIETLYGNTTAQTILSGGIASQIYFGGCDLKTCEMLEKMMGNTIVREVDNLGRMVYIKEPLKNIAQIRTLLDNEALYLFSNKKPILLHIKPYYKHSILKKLSQINSLEFEGIKKENELCYMDVSSITSRGEVKEIDYKSEQTEAEIDNLNNNKSYQIKEMSEEQYQSYLEGVEKPIFDLSNLHENTRKIIDDVRTKVVYFRLTFSLEEMVNEFRFSIKKKCKKLLDLPNYFEKLSAIRKSVWNVVGKILEPEKCKPKRYFFDSYTDMCNYRSEDHSDVGVGDIVESYTERCKK